MFITHLQFLSRVAKRCLIGDGGYRFNLPQCLVANSMITFAIYVDISLYTVLGITPMLHNTRLEDFSTQLCELFAMLINGWIITVLFLLIDGCSTARDDLC